MNNSATTSTHTAHVARRRDPCPKGDLDPPQADLRDTPKRGEHGQRGAVRCLPTVTYPRPKCPECGHFRLGKYRSIVDQGDGSSLSWVRCLNERCGHRFKLLLE